MGKLLKTVPLILFLAICFVAGLGLRQNSMTPVKEGSLETTSTPNYRYQLPDLGGNSRSSNEWQDKLQIVNFWASWCGPCLEEMPRFIKLQERYGNQGIQFIGIGIDQVEALQKIVDRLGVNYPVLQGDFDAMQVAKQFGNTYGVLPFTSVISPAGELITEIAGGVKVGEMEAIIKRYLAEQGPG